jgi:predicted DsbA family dithiol-disulfide isomerase
MHIEIYHDTVCPWCRIGKQNLNLALQHWQTAQPTPVEITYRAFFLQPDLPPEGADFYEIMVAKMGRYGVIDRSSLEPMFDGPRTAGARVGLTFNFERITRAPNTIDSHRLIMLTPESHKVQMIDALYKAYFEDGQDIGDRAVLERIGKAVGIDESTLNRLNGEDYRREVTTEYEQALSLGVTGVPFFVLDGKYTFSGAQPPATIIRLFKQVYG